MSSLTVGLLRVVLHLPDSGSLKSKRRVVSGLLRDFGRSTTSPPRRVGELDRWQLAELAMATVARAAAAMRCWHRCCPTSTRRDGAHHRVSTELIRL
jgi:uncharacterized protein YlxP (DUF503 family)